MKTIDVYTDGSCNPQTKKGGWAFTMDLTNTWVEKGWEDKYGHKVNTTNNRMEMTAIIMAIRYIMTIGDSGTYCIHTDSQVCLYVVDAITNGDPLYKYKNPDLVTELKELITISKATITFKKIKAHSGNEGNERADKLAKKAMQTIQDVPTKEPMPTPCKSRGCREEGHYPVGNNDHALCKDSSTYQFSETLYNLSLNNINSLDTPHGKLSFSFE